MTGVDLQVVYVLVMNIHDSWKDRDTLPTDFADSQTSLIRLLEPN